MKFYGDNLMNFSWKCYLTRCWGSSWSVYFQYHFEIITGCSTYSAMTETPAISSSLSERIHKKQQLSSLRGSLDFRGSLTLFQSRSWHPITLLWNSTSFIAAAKAEMTTGKLNTDVFWLYVYSGEISRFATKSLSYISRGTFHLNSFFTLSSSE